jgi:hypothetical protein
MTSFYANASIGLLLMICSEVHSLTVSVFVFRFQLNNMSRQDGLISILRGFKREELLRFSEKLNFKKYKIQWKWAFRYQWIISKI